MKPGKRSVASAAGEGAFESFGDVQVWRPAGTQQWPWLQLAVTTRRGGRSAAPYDALNLSAATGDRPADVDANRNLLRRALGLERASWHTLHQVHGAAVLEARRPRGAGADTNAASTPRADGLWTADVGRVLVVGVADCVPVFLWDARERRVALVHAGWRGTAAGIVGVAVRTLRDAGTDPTDVWVAMGPSIGPCCYAVGDEVCGALPDAVVRVEGETHVDLRAANAQQARTSGVPSEQIHAMAPCTGCTPQLFYSHRKQGAQTGRQWALAWITP